jgi:hypothetical protein
MCPNPKFASSVLQCVANFGIGTPAGEQAEPPMRGLMAFAFGILATIGFAYWHDLGIDQSKKLVNWDVASELSRTAAARAREEWDRLTAK